MRHLYFGRRLSRDTKSRKALLNNLASSLIVHGQLSTTLAKAKFAQSYIEKLITQSKKARLARSRILASKLGHDALIKLINEVGPGFENRKGGYTRIVKTYQRRGDAAPMAKLELLEWDTTKAKKPDKKSTKNKKSTRKTSKTSSKIDKKITTKAKNEKRKA